jgi:hypothetical protein
MENISTDKLNSEDNFSNFVQCCKYAELDAIPINKDQCNQTKNIDVKISENGKDMTDKNLHTQKKL